MRELKVIYRYATNSFQTVLTNPVLFFIFLFSKIARIGLFIIFLGFLFANTKNVFGYSGEQIIFFYLSYNLLDTTAQLLFRQVYRFRPTVLSGNFDMVLLKPISPLASVLFGGPDVIDLAMLLLVALGTSWYAATYIHPQFVNVLSYLLLFVVGLTLAASFHILVLGLGIITTSVDHIVMIYRDLTAMLRIPVDFYTEPIRAIITFIVPLGIMFSFAPKALIGALSPGLILYSLIFSLISIKCALIFWHFSLRHYSSASS